MAAKAKKETPVDLASDDLLQAVYNFVEAKGGKALVVGGVSVEDRGGHRYTLRIDFTGHPPRKQE